MNSRNDSALSESLEIWHHDAHDSLANLERLGVAYKALHSNAPQALDPAVVLAVLWQAAPHSMAKVMGRVFAPMGYTVARRTVVRALSDGHMDEAEAARVLECVSQLKDAAGRMKDAAGRMKDAPDA